MVKVQSVVQHDGQVGERETGQKAIIVSSDKDLTSIMEYALSSYGLEVACYGNSNEALDDSILGELDIIIADYSTPGIHGLDFTRRLRKQYPMAIIIGISGSDMETDSLCAGANDFLRKPFVPYRLAMMISGADILS
jgi:DNA-binding response OmpR family regulator